MSTRMYQLITFAVCFLAACSIGCRAGQGTTPNLFQQAGNGFTQQNFGQLGQRVGNMTLNRVINAGITRVLGGF